MVRGCESKQGGGKNIVNLISFFDCFILHFGDFHMFIDGVWQKRQKVDQRRSEDPQTWPQREFGDWTSEIGNWVSVLEIMENRGRQGQINLNGKQRFCQH
jgi:hypothetical protein